MAALYRIEVDGWANEDAVAEMRHFGYHDWYKDLVAFVRDGLLDPLATPEHLCGLIPPRVPSGMPVIAFEGC